MKKFLLGTAATAALMAIASPASAQTSELHYASPGPIPYTITNPNFLGFLAGEAGVALQVGTRYTATADAPSDSVAATPTVNVVFNLSGRVNKDCSFYSGNNAGARNIDFGVIGVRTGDNENVNNAFEMRLLERSQAIFPSRPFLFRVLSVEYAFTLQPLRFATRAPKHFVFLQSLGDTSLVFHCFGITRSRLFFTVVVAIIILKALL